MKGIQYINAGAIARYAILPGIVPRVKEFAGSGFGWLARLMAITYASVRLLPPDHPYLRPENAGRFGIRHVIAAAAHNLTFKLANIDQIVLFLALLVGFVVLVLQFAYVFLFFVIRPAFATSIFRTPGTGGGAGDPTYDVAFMLLDSVFGVKGFFRSCIDQNIACSPGGVAPTGPASTAFHDGLHALLSFYSNAMLLVGVIILVYYIIVVVAETAQTGTPFGKRFSHIWAPIRLVVALGLLIPLNYGLNSAQYITLAAAKYGSSMATNAWRQYNAALVSRMGPQNNPTGQSSESLIARPSVPQVGHVMQFMALARTCKAGYETVYGRTGSSGKNINAYLTRHAYAPVDVPVNPTAANWNQAVQFYNYGDIVISFGDDGRAKLPGPDDAYKGDKSGVRPYCGEIIVHTKDLSLPGALIVQQGYYRWIAHMWNDNVNYGDGGPGNYGFARRMSCFYLGNYNSAGITAGVPGCPAGADKKPDAAWKKNRAVAEKNYVTTFIDTAFAAMKANPAMFTISGGGSDLLDRGWGGAGIWYNRIAQWNGALFGATQAVPTPSYMPLVMDEVENARKAANESTDAADRYQPALKNNQTVTLTGGDKEKQIARLLNGTYVYWRSSPMTESTRTLPSGNAIIGLITVIFGTDGLFEMRNADNMNVHPMAQLSGVGKSIMDAARRNLMIGLAFATGGGMLEQFSPAFGEGMSAMGSLLVSFGTMTLTIGFILYYLLPLLPFLYFFFAVSSWVKTIFEAMVGLPLWALAHLRINGEGLPGSAAMNGYFLIFEIFIRPILTVFGLIGSMAVFSAMVKTMNGIFGLVTHNLTGFDCGACAVPIVLDLTFQRGVVDQFFFTVIYTILTYLLATSSFKMIDKVPAGVLNWMGSSARSFADDNSGTQGELMRMAAFGGQAVTQQVTGALMGAGRTAGQGLGMGINALTGRNSGETLEMKGGGPPRHGMPQQPAQQPPPPSQSHQRTPRAPQPPDDDK